MLLETTNKSNFGNYFILNIDAICGSFAHLVGAVN